MSALFHFDWYVDQHGYEEVVYERGVERGAERRAALSAKEGKYIRGKGGPLRAYRPLEDFPGLHRRFAELPMDTPAILEFVHMFGLLGSSSSESWLGEEDLSYWHGSITSMRHMVHALDVGERDRNEACEWFNIHMNAVPPHRPQVSVWIKYGPGLRAQSRMVPSTLLGAMYLQMLDELTGRPSFKKCKWCPNWFSYGRGTGRRETKEFCSDRCRVAWNREKKRAIADKA